MWKKSLGKVVHDVSRKGYGGYTIISDCDCDKLKISDDKNTQKDIKKQFGQNLFVHQLR